VRQIGGVTVEAPGFVASAGCRGGGGQGGAARCSGAPEIYRARQQLANATVSTDHTRGSDNRTLSTESYVHAGRNLLVTRLRVTGGGARAERLQLVLWTVGQGIGAAHNYPNKAIRLPPNISDPSLIPACAFPTRAGCVTSQQRAGAFFADGNASCGGTVGSVVGGAISRMAGFPFQQTYRQGKGTNVTVMAAALRVILQTYDDQGRPNSTREAALRNIIVERGSSGNDRVSFTVDLLPTQELVLLTALISNRDAGWADPVQAATNAVMEILPLPHWTTQPALVYTLAELDASHRRWWAQFWTKSHIRIETDRPAFDTGVHRFYYGALHVLASASRTGKVAPGLYGPWVTCDHVCAILCCDQPHGILGLAVPLSATTRELTSRDLA
jgi:hypothetical protein